MKIIYDPEVDAAYINFSNKPQEIITQRLSEDIALNFGTNNQLAGIEILSAKHYLSPKNQKIQIEGINLETIPMQV